jgi:hypothetical protein
MHSPSLNEYCNKLNQNNDEECVNKEANIIFHTNDDDIDFGQCAVCMDKANGVHYGVVTCEGCKGFFKRSITKHHTYACYLGKQCAMTLKGRKDCRYCRWIACLNAGMTYDGKYEITKLEPILLVINY